MTSHPLADTARRTMLFSEIVSIAIDSFRVAKVRFVLTALGMVIGTASLIMVVTIGLTGKQYALNQIQSIGANMIVAYWEGGGNATVNTGPRDDLTVQDMQAVRTQVPGIQAASPMWESHDRIAVGEGKERDILILGVDPEYAIVRNLEVLAGRFFDDEDAMSRFKVAVVTQKFAQRVYGGQDAAVERDIKIKGLPFKIIGTFRERVDTLGQGEIADDTILIPYNVTRSIFSGNDQVKQLFFSAADASEVPQTTEQIRQVIQSRHRPESVYHVDNLAQLLQVAGRIANGLTLVLLGVSLITLIVSGVGIMNIMLANVRTRIREIGIRKAIGATKREIGLQFLTEAVLISLAGGIVGTLLGLAVPFSVRFFTEYRIPISGLSAIIAITVASLVGVVFGTLPATRAAQLDPVEALHYE
jgi:putative ABC transport system permease protein